VISIEPHGADLAAVTPETRRMALDAACCGYIAQVWTWRGGEAVVANAYPRPLGADWLVVVRRGLRRGVPRRVPAGSMADALHVLGIAYRIRSPRRRSNRPAPTGLAARRRVLLRGIHRRGNRWRTLHTRRLSTTNS
jgi:hypothetical protein